MIFYYAFLVAVFVIAIGVAIVCARAGRTFFLWWIFASMVLGLAGLFIPWRTASLFHYGSGSPIPMVIWERIESGAYIDFPGPIAIILDPIAVYIIGTVAWLAAWTCRFILRSRADGQAARVA